MSPVADPWRYPAPMRRLPLAAWELRTAARAVTPRGTGRPPPTPGPADPGRHLQQVLTFWAEHAVDRRHGGFFCELARTGVPRPGPKSAAMTARHVYAFSLGFQHTGDERWRALARHGLDFLVSRMHDDVHGGWFETVDRDGTPRSERKRLFDQAYVILGLARSGEPDALRLAEETWDLLERRSWSGADGGYPEVHDRTWDVVSDRRTVCVHLDVLKAALALGRTERAERLGDLLVRRMRLAGAPPVLETFTPRWVYDPRATGDRLELGHVFKAARLLRVVGSHEQAADDLLAWGLTAGEDVRGGGLFSEVFRSGRVASTDKQWWTACEAVGALVAAGTEAARRRASELVGWCLATFVDPVHGEWYLRVDAAGRAVDDRKATLWKASYHTADFCESALALAAPGEA
jgi:mannobiose 2-epimerase